MRMYVDAGAKFPAGQPIIVTAADETAAMMVVSQVVV